MLRGRIRRLGVVCALLFAVAAPALASSDGLPHRAPIVGDLAAQRWLIVVDPTAPVGTADAILPPVLERLGLEVDGVFTHAVQAILVRGPGRLLGSVASLNGVKLIVEDTVLAVADPIAYDQQVTLPDGRDTVGTNLQRVGGPAPTAEPVDADIAIVDSGIDPHHPDLDVVGGKDCSFASPPRLLGDPAWADVNGHGTMVAGIAAAKADGEGMVGVAPGARLWSVKVTAAQLVRSELDPAGVLPGSLDAVPDLPGQLDQVYASSLVCAFDWLTANAGTIEVANLSFGGLAPNRPCDGVVDGGTGMERRRPDPVAAFLGPYLDVPPSDIVQEALCAATAAGVIPVSSAGNSGDDLEQGDYAYFPAARPDVIAVSAIADFDGLPGGLAGRHDVCSTAAFPYLGDVSPAAFEALYGPPRPALTQADDTFATFSNRGPAIDVAAVGTCALGTRVGGGHTVGPGTSFAAPAVSGAVALVKARVPQASVADVLWGLSTAGKVDYDASTDRDGIQEPRLDVRALLALLG